MNGNRLHPPERPRLAVRHEAFPFESRFKTASGERRKADVVFVEITEGTRRGRGECVPDPAIGETIDSVIAEIEHMAPAVETGVVSRRSLGRSMPAGAARNAIDCALWDFEAKRGQGAVWLMAGQDQPRRVTTAYTIERDTPEAMAKVALEENHRPLLRLDLGQEGDLDCVAAVREAVPKIRLIVHAHGGWTPYQLETYSPVLKTAEVELIEQPLPIGEEAILGSIRHVVPICADESCRTEDDLARIGHLYSAVNVSLDKAGGLTAAFGLIEAARLAGLKILVSSPVCTSLGIAPAVFLAQEADWVDLSSPLLLSRDRQPGLRYDGSTLFPPNVNLWG